LEHSLLVYLFKFALGIDQQMKCTIETSFITYIVLSCTSLFNTTLCLPEYL